MTVGILFLLLAIVVVLIAGTILEKAFGLAKWVKYISAIAIIIGGVLLLILAFASRRN